MLIAKMHDRVRQWMDTVGSGRLSPEDIDNALNTAIDNKVNDLFYPLNPKEIENSFQSNQRMRDSLFTLIPPPVTLYPSGNTNYSLVPISNYRYCIELFAMVNDKEYITHPLSYEDYEARILLDPYSKPTTKYPAILYRLEIGNYFTIMFGPGTLGNGRMVYLKNPAKVHLDPIFANNMDCDVPELLHEEICQIAAEILKAQFQNLTQRK